MDAPNADGAPANAENPLPPAGALALAPKADCCGCAGAPNADCPNALVPVPPNAPVAGLTSEGWPNAEGAAVWPNADEDGGWEGCPKTDGDAVDGWPNAEAAPPAGWPNADAGWPNDGWPKADPPVVAALNADGWPNALVVAG